MINVSVVKRQQEAQDIISLTLEAVDGAELPAFAAGAHIDVHLPGGLVRQYSLCNAPGDCSSYQIAVLKDPASRGGSVAVHGLQVGDVLSISLPRNLFALDTSAQHSVLFAGGIGITPILAMAEQLSQAGQSFELHYCTRHPDKTAFLGRLRQAAFAQNVHCYFDDGADQRRLDVNRVVVGPSPVCHLYVCGPTGFMDYVLDTARQTGWTEPTLHKEYFSAAPVDSAEDSSFEVKLGSSGQVFVIPPGQSVVKVLEAAGVDIPVACEQGICGTCLTPVLDGVPDHRDQYLTPEEQALNNQFTPCCSRAKSACLVLGI